MHVKSMIPYPHHMMHTNNLTILSSESPLHLHTHYDYKITTTPSKAPLSKLK